MATLLISESVNLRPVLDDLESEIGPEVLSELHQSGYYNQIMGYLAECTLNGIPPVEAYDDDVMRYSHTDIARLAKIVEKWKSWK